METKDLVMLSKALITKMYTDKTDTRDWAFAFSGGKDSSAVAALVVSVVESLPPEQRTRKVYGVMSDTVVENPLVHDHMHKQAKLINKYCGEKGLPITVTIVQRELEQSYFVKTLGLGYFLPLNNGQGRWCTDRLKIQPQNTFLKEINPSYILTGVRMAESTARAASIEKWQIDEFIGGHANLKDTNTLNPLIHWTIKDVWRFLEVEGFQWGSTLSVRTIYRDATGECGFSNPEGTEQKGVEVCGARHGCWLCPVVLKDRSTEKMSEKHEWLEPLTEWRTLQLYVYGQTYPKELRETENRKFNRLKKKLAKAHLIHVKHKTKAGFNRGGKKLKKGQGTLTLHARQFLLNELLETEKMMNRLRKLQGLEPLRLISQEEIDYIKALWKEDEDKRPYLIGKPLNLPLCL